MRPEGVPQIRRLEWIVKMVREGRLELPLCRQSWILSPVRLPIPPLSLNYIVEAANEPLTFKTDKINLFLSIKPEIVNIKPQKCQVNSKVIDAVLRTCCVRHLLMVVCFVWCFLVAQTVWSAPPLLFDDTDAIVALDPGHGGHDRGARGPTGLLEKRVTLELAHKLALRLESRYLVRLTRSDDYDVELHQRAATANHSKADLFISLHTGAGFVHAPQGLSVYYYKSGRPGAESITEKATVAEPRQWKHLQQRYAAASKTLATHMQHAFAAMPQRPSCQVLGAPLAVLQGADMPAVLIEVGQITHPATEKLLSQSHGLNVLVNAIDQGIERFLMEYPPTKK